MLKQYIVDAFSDSIFHGNPAAVCVLEEWLPDELMIQIAAENNLSETAFTVKEGTRYHLRWFTPSAEINLCGHATLATAYVLLNYYELNAPQIVFDTMSGDYFTASAFGFWIACNVLRSGRIPQLLKPVGTLPEEVRNMLIYNQFRGKGQSLILLQKV